MPLALTDAQLATVTEAAALLPPASRDHFLRSVTAVLSDYERPSDAAVCRALGLVLSERRVAVGREALAIGRSYFPNDAPRRQQRPDQRRGANYARSMAASQSRDGA